MFILFIIIIISSPGALLQVSLCHGLLAIIHLSVIRSSVVSLSYLLQNHKLDWADT